MYLLIVTGLSGAGKSMALKCLEEKGFFCVDNLPSSMLSEYVHLCEQAKPPILKAAITVDSRESLLSRDSQKILDALDALTIPCEVLFLDCRDDVLRKRYNEVRRRHPLGEAGDAESGVQRERIFLQPLRDRANYILDTTDVKAQDFPKLISKVLPEMESHRMTLLFSSFGYKRGVPIDVPELRNLSGLDEPVRDFVLSHSEVSDFLDRMEQVIRSLIPGFEHQEKHILRICCGCTGGRHRSVAAAEELARRFESDPVSVRVYQRDLDLEASDIRSRFSGS